MVHGGSICARKYFLLKSFVSDHLHIHHTLQGSYLKQLPRAGGFRSRVGLDAAGAGEGAGWVVGASGTSISGSLTSSESMDWSSPSLSSRSKVYHRQNYNILIIVLNVSFLEWNGPIHFMILNQPSVIKNIHQLMKSIGFLVIIASWLAWTFYWIWFPYSN